MDEIFSKYLVTDIIELIKKVFTDNATHLTKLMNASYLGTEYSKTYKTICEINSFGELSSNKANGVIGFHCSRDFIYSCLDAIGLTKEQSADYEDMEMNLPATIINDFVLKALPSFIELGYNFRYKPMDVIYGMNCNVANNKSHVSMAIKFFLEGHEVFLSFCVYIPELNDFSVVQDDFCVVPAFSIAESETIPFDVYLFLRTNNKLLKIFSAKIPIDPDFKQKILRQKHDLLYISKNNIDDYQNYVKEDIIKKMQDIKNTSDNHTVIVNFQSTVKGLFKTLVQNPDVGKSLVDQCSVMIKDSVATMCNEKDFFKKINAIIEKFGTKNSHYVNVSTFSIMFAIALEVTDPSELKELGMAATFHDIGKIKFPDSMKEKSTVLMTPDEYEIYKKHPQYSLDMLKASNAKLGPLAYRMIIEHHEKISGTGFPNALKEAQIHPYSQILSIADRFENLICGFSETKGLAPQDAMKKMLEENSASKEPAFNQEILSSLFSKLGG
jgi:HD-GYP domain-containing protein (c-di-GMP phosphodiesterase class II)